MFAIWNDIDKDFAHIRGRVVCFHTMGQGVAFVLEKCPIREGWTVVDLEQNQELLWHATCDEDHKVWLYDDENGECVDMSASSCWDVCEETDEGIYHTEHDDDSDAPDWDAS